MGFISAAPPLPRFLETRISTWDIGVCKDYIGIPNLGPTLGSDPESPEIPSCFKTHYGALLVGTPLLFWIYFCVNGPKRSVEYQVVAIPLTSHEISAFQRRFSMSSQTLTQALGIGIAQSRKYVYTSGSRAGIVYVFGSLGKEAYPAERLSESCVSRLRLANCRARILAAAPSTEITQLPSNTHCSYQQAEVEDPC